MEISAATTAETSRETQEDQAEPRQSVPDLPTYSRPYLDTTTWIDYLQGEESSGTPERAALAVEIFEYAEAGKITIVASALIAAELLKDPTVHNEDAHELRQFFRRACFVWVALDLPLAEQARELARRHTLKPADAVHLASAIAGEADVLLTSDADFREDQRYDGLRAAQPYFPFDRPMFDQKAAVDGSDESAYGGNTPGRPVNRGPGSGDLDVETAGEQDLSSDHG